MTDRERFLACLLGQPVDRPPYWIFWGRGSSGLCSAIAQAGRIKHAANKVKNIRTSSFFLRLAALICFASSCRAIAFNCRAHGGPPGTPNAGNDDPIPSAVTRRKALLTVSASLLYKTEAASVKRPNKRPNKTPIRR